MMERINYPAIMLLAITALIRPNYIIGQSGNLQVDSIKRHLIIVDSLVHSFYQNPETRLIHWTNHYSCINGGLGDADLYKDTDGKNILKLIYSDNCNSIQSARAYYFTDNKIVSLIITVSKRGKTAEMQKYFRNDKLIFLSGNMSTNKKHSNDDKDLEKGYELLSDFKN